MNTPSDNSIRMDYEQFVRDYVDNLNVTLRGFKAGDGIDAIETFVPSDDPNHSILDLAELLRDAGVKSWIMVFGAENDRRIDPGVISSTVTYQRTPVADRFEYRFVVLPRQVRPQELPVHPAYQDKIAQALRSISHEGPLSPGQGQELISAGHEGALLHALIENGRVIRGGFENAGTPARAAVLDAACRLMVNLPVVECHDHVMIQVERCFRDATRPAPVAGLVTPDNADPVFAFGQTLVRQLCAPWLAKEGKSLDANFFDRPPSREWSRLTPAQRVDAINAFLASQGLGTQILAIGMESAKRVVVRIDDALASNAKQDLLVKAQALLHGSVEGTLNLVAQARTDTNVLRLPDRKNKI